MVLLFNFPEMHFIKWFGAHLETLCGSPLTCDAFLRVKNKAAKKNKK